MKPEKICNILGWTCFALSPLVVFELPNFHITDRATIFLTLVFGGIMLVLMGMPHSHDNDRLLPP